jgi:hypothetical protein
MQNPSISAIFEIGKDGKYSNEALLYQYILKYPILNGEHSLSNNKDSNCEFQVSSWKIMTWLIKTLPEFKLKYSNDNISKTIPKVRRRIMGRLDDLVKLELLSNEKVKQKKSDGTTDSFSFIILGKLLGWIINSIDFDNSIVNDNTTTNNREIINKQIFNLLQRIFKTGPYSPTIDVLASNFISKCKQLNLFGNIVNMLKNALNDKETLIDDISDLLNSITTCNFKDQNSKVIFTSLWDETIIELEPKIKNVVFYNLKLAFERDIQDHVKAFQPYEKMWFKYKSDNRVVAVECSCTNRECDCYTPAAMDIMQYKERKFFSTTDWNNLTPLALEIYKNRSFTNYHPSDLSARCQACGKGSLRLSFPG